MEEGGDGKLWHFLPFFQLGLQGIYELGEFDRISDEPLRVGQISHKAIIEVDQQGTVGASATGIEIVAWIASFEVNKPHILLG